MQKISLFHLFILQIESILESKHMTGYIHYLTTPTPKILKNLLQSVKIS